MFTGTLSIVQVLFLLNMVQRPLPPKMTGQHLLYHCPPNHFAAKMKPFLHCQPGADCRKNLQPAYRNVVEEAESDQCIRFINGWLKLVICISRVLFL